MNQAHTSHITRSKGSGLRICLFPPNLFFHVLFLLFFIYALGNTCCFADEPTEIRSDSIEYLESSATYIATGNVKVQKEGIVIEAEEIHYNEKTSDVRAIGSVRYDDEDVLITASRADINIQNKTGVLYDATIFSKKDNYHMNGKIIEKRGDTYYYSPEATFTTCDAPIPAWCFKGKNIRADLGNSLKASDVSFRIKNLPILYTPYFNAPIHSERKTGFLFPEIGYSESRGVHFNLPFFWALSENRDITLHGEVYTERGYGEGIEYRYVEPNDAKGQWWVYHLRDNDLKKDFFELRARHEQRSPDKIGGFLNVNYINDGDYYREFSNRIEVRTNRFLESSGEISMPFTNSRLYLLSQYWTDLRETGEDPPERLPELGFTVNPIFINPFTLSLYATVSNFWREENIHGQRVDIYPKVYHAIGDTVELSQSLGIRETLYALKESSGDDHPHREAFEYQTALHTRIVRKFGSFSHIVEPNLEYKYITTNRNNLNIFDENELYTDTSLIGFSLLNRFIKKDGEFLTIRVAQGFNTEAGNKPLEPLHFELAIRKPFLLRLESKYDVYSGDFESINSNIALNISDITFSASQRYSKENDITYYNGGLRVHPFQPIYLGFNLWYDEKEKEIKEFSTNLTLAKQCWGFDVQYVKRPDDFSVSLLFELKGLMKSLQFMN